VPLQIGFHAGPHLARFLICMGQERGKIMNTLQKKARSAIKKLQNDGAKRNSRHFRLISTLPSLWRLPLAYWFSWFFSC
jgi:hypothetical protein